jgi:hypothetical protein
MKQSYRQLDGFEAYVRSLFDGKNTWTDIARLVAERYGIAMTKGQLKAYAKNHRLVYGRRDYVPPRTAFVAIPGFMAWFESIQSGKTAAEVSNLANELGFGMTPAQVMAFRKNHKIASGRTGRFERGHVPFTKGKRQEEYMSPAGIEKASKTRFKKGNKPHNWLPVGTVTTKSDGYLWIKTAEPDKWMQYQRWIWLQAGRTIPDGCLVTFLDGNNRNFNLDNLAVVTEGESAELTTRHLRFGSGTIGQVGLDIAKVHLAVRRKR